MNKTLTKAEILDYCNKFNGLPKGHAKLTYACAKNMRKLKPAYDDLAADLNPPPEHQEYENALRVAASIGAEEVKAVSTKYREVIELRAEQLKAQPALLREEIELDGLHMIDESAVPMDELTPAQLVALLPFINEAPE